MTKSGTPHFVKKKKKTKKQNYFRNTEGSFVYHLPIAIVRRKWQSTPVFLPGESCGQRSLVGCCPWGPTDSDKTEAIQHACVYWRRKWQHTRVFLPGESQGQMSLVGCHLWGRTESDLTEATQQQQHCYCYTTTKELSIWKGIACKAKSSLFYSRQKRFTNPCPKYNAIMKTNQQQEKQVNENLRVQQILLLLNNIFCSFH